MAEWTDIADSNLEPNAPIRSVDGLALRDNPIAIAEGAAGAPRISGQQGPVVQNGGVFNGTLGAEKFQTGTTERDWVLERTAAASVGAVGTYGFFSFPQNFGGSPGATFPGSDLRYSNAGASTTPSESPSGTWRLMGKAVESTGDILDRTSLFLRIS